MDVSESIAEMDGVYAADFRNMKDDLKAMKKEIVQFVVSDHNSPTKRIPKKIVLAGKWSLSHAEIIEKLRKEGHSVSGKISKSTDLLLCSDPNAATNKLQQASEYGIQIQTYETFFQSSSTGALPNPVIACKICDETIDNKEERGILRCEACNISNDEDDIMQCDICGRVLCFECGQFIECDKCEKQFCVNCHSSIDLSYCNESTLSNRCKKCINPSPKTEETDFDAEFNKAVESLNVLFEESRKDKEELERLKSELAKLKSEGFWALMKFKLVLPSNNTDTIYNKERMEKVNTPIWIEEFF